MRTIKLISKEFRFLILHGIVYAKIRSCSVSTLPLLVRGKLFYWIQSKISLKEKLNR